MATITIRKELQDFLEKEGILDVFIENVTRDYVKWGVTQESNEEEEDVDTAFIFDETEQGYKYWKGISDKWDNYKHIVTGKQIGRAHV